MFEDERLRSEVSGKGCPNPEEWRGRSRAAGRRSRDLKPNWSTRDTLNRVLSGEQLKRQRVTPRNNHY